MRRPTDVIVRPRREQLRRDARFAGGLAVRAVGMMAAGALIGMVMWTILPIAGGYRPNLVTSDSMSPSIRTGDVVLTRAIDRDDLRAGQVVLVDDPDRREPLLHRVRRIEGGEIVTQGDGNATPDSRSSRPVAVVGVGRLLVPGIGRPVLLLGDHPELVLLAAGGALIVVGGASLRPVRLRS